MSLSAALLTDQSLATTQQGAVLKVGLNWYRSLPLSSVQTLDITLDNYRVPRGDIQFDLNGESHALDDLRAIWDEEWYMLDLATLRFATPAPLKVGQEIEVTVRMGSLIPYILVRPDSPLEYISVKTRQLKVVSDKAASAIGDRP